MSALRTLWWLGARLGLPFQALGPPGAPPCFSEEVEVLCPACSSVGAPVAPTGGVSFLRWGWEDKACLARLSRLHFSFKPSILTCFCCLENKLFVLLSRGGLGSSQGSSGSLLTPWPRKPFPLPSPAAARLACAAWWSGPCPCDTLILKPVLLLFPISLLLLFCSSSAERSDPAS